MSAPPATVSLIVLTFNARPFVARCLDGVRQQSTPPDEVIVVDNASTDGTAEFVQAQFPEVRLLRAGSNGGYGAGNNLGAQHATGTVLVFLNHDAVPEADWLEHLVGSMQRHGRSFATSKITLSSNPDRLNSSGNLIHYLGPSFCRGLNACRSSYTATELVQGASGAAFAITRDLFRHLGGFDPSIFMYHDDVDISLRALLAGERCLYVPEAIVEHDYRLQLPPAKWAWMESYRYGVLVKTYSLRTLLLLLPALLAFDLLTIGYLALRGPAFVSAKLRSYAWVVRNARTIGAQRRRMQRLRVVSDRDIIRALNDRLPYEQLSPGPLGQLAAFVVDPWFRLYRRLMLAVIQW